MRRMVIFNHTLALGLLVLLLGGALYIAPWRDESSFCSRCHLEWSQAAYAKPASSDIPRYPGLAWTTPMPVCIWRGESWTPEDAAFKENVMVSGLHKDLTGRMVWEFYRKQMPGLGWKLISAQPPPNPKEFKVTFTKQNGQCTIWFRSTGQPAGGESGARIEITYN